MSPDVFRMTISKSNWENDLPWYPLCGELGVKDDLELSNWKAYKPWHPLRDELVIVP